MADEIRGSDPDWKIEDYFVDFGDIVWPGGQLIDLPLEMKLDKVRKHVFAVLQEAKSCLSIKSELAAAVLALAVVDYLAGFHSGKQTSGADYKRFMAEYFPPNYSGHRGWIYSHLRCGLMHNLAAANPWRGSHRDFTITTTGGNHLVELDHKFVFAVDVFVVDTYRAWVMYAHYLIMKANRDEAEVSKFNERFDRLDGRGALMETA